VVVNGAAPRVVDLVPGAIGLTGRLTWFIVKSRREV
jgi:hypothetical protein